MKLFLLNNLAKGLQKPQIKVIEDNVVYFPLTGLLGFDFEECIQDYWQAITYFLSSCPSYLTEIMFVCMDRASTQVMQQQMASLAGQYTGPAAANQHSASTSTANQCSASTSTANQCSAIGPFTSHSSSTRYPVTKQPAGGTRRQTGS